MKEYAKFLSKRILYRKSNILFILLTVMIIGIFFFMNTRSQGELSTKLNSQIKSDIKTIEIYKEKLSGLTKDNEAYKLNDGTIQFAKSNIKAFKKLLTYVHQENWMKFYEGYRDVLEKRQSIIENSGMLSNNGSTKPANLDTVKELTYISYLMNHQLDYENPDFPVSGLTFTTSISQIILPVLVVVFCIYILAQIYTLDYVKNIDVSMLLPIRRYNVVLTKIMVGTGFTIFAFLLILLISFMFATLFTFDTGFAYPIMIQNMKTGIWEAVSALSLLKDWLLLGILFCVCLSLFTYFVSLFIKEDMYLLLVVLCVVLGLAYMPSIVDQLKEFSHILPTTYMNYVNVANGLTSIQYSNSHITTSFGILVLVGAITIQSVLCVVFNVGKHKIKGLCKKK